MNNFGFIILRHVQNELHNKFWTTSYTHIRRHYPSTPIVIIDDSSDYSFVKNDDDLFNTDIIQSEFPKCGELLPYVYLLKNRLFENAMIIHDSVFINSQLDLNFVNYKMLWTFNHISNQPSQEKKILSQMKNGDDLIKLYNDKNKWRGCFGAMSLVSHEYLELINEKFDFYGLLPLIKSKEDRMCFERIIGCLFHYFDKQPTMFGDIHAYCPWGMKYNQAIKYTNLPVIKAWSGRR